ncbi:MAG: mechanosensitive ion channel [Bacteroidia bacterium]
MDELLNQEISGTGNVIWTLLAGLLIAFVYTLVKKIVMPSMGKGTSGKRWLDRLALTERIYWPTLALVVLMSLLASRPLAGTVVSIVLFAVLFYPFRNFILGLIYWFGNTYSIGQRITYESKPGSIRSFNTLSLELELEDGSMLDIPYVRFAEATIVRSSPRSGVLRHGIDLRIQKPCDIELEKQNIRSHLLAMPYVLPDEKIVFEQLTDETDHYSVKVMVKGIDKIQLFIVESRLKALYADENLSRKI